MGEIRFVGTVETRGYPYLVCKKKVSHSLIAVGAVGVRVPLYLGAHPSSFAALSFPNSKKVPIYGWVDRESFPVAAWRSRASNSALRRLSAS